MTHFIDRVEDVFKETALTEALNFTFPKDWWKAIFKFLEETAMAITFAEAGIDFVV